MKNRDLTSNDVDFLSLGFKARYIIPAYEVGHAVIIKNEKDEKEFLQYAIPQGISKDVPKLIQLKNIKEVKHNKITGYRTESLDGHPMYAMRFIHGRFDNRFFTIAFFTPKKTNDFWRSTYSPVLFKIPDEKNEVGDEDQAEIYEARYKGSDWVTIDPQLMKQRENQNRDPNPWYVMGESACDVYNDFAWDRRRELSAYMSEVFATAISANLTGTFSSQLRPEWVHAIPFIFAPKEMDPQVTSNLGAAPKWVTVEMMVLSHVVRWFANNCSGSTQKIKSRFKMLFDTEIIEEIHYQVSIEDQGHTIELSQIINPFLRWPEARFRQATDLTQAVAVVHAMLNGKSPILTQRLHVNPISNEASFFGSAEKRSPKRKNDQVEEAEQPEQKHARINPM